MEQTSIYCCPFCGNTDLQRSSSPLQKSVDYWCTCCHLTFNETQLAYLKIVEPKLVIPEGGLL